MKATFATCAARTPCAMHTPRPYHPVSHVSMPSKTSGEGWFVRGTKPDTQQRHNHWKPQCP
eukprot:576679-Alexandrium_andersonii.AAC.1